MPFPELQSTQNNRHYTHDDQEPPFEHLPIHEPACVHEIEISMRASSQRKQTAYEVLCSDSLHLLTEAEHRRAHFRLDCTLSVRGLAGRAVETFKEQTLGHGRHRYHIMSG